MKDIHKVVLLGINPNATTGVAPYFLKAYVQTEAELWSKLEFNIRYFSPLDKPWTIAKEVLCEHPWLVGYSAYCWNVRALLEVAKQIKTHNPKVIQVMGGPEVESQELRLLRDNTQLDIVVTGEGEASFHEVLRSLVLGSMPIDEIRGIAYRDGMKPHLNPARPLIENIDTIPSPILTGLLDPMNSGLEALAFQTYRGCTNGCAFCKWGERKVRFFSLERIEKELEILCSSSIRSVWWCDAIFNLNRKRTSRILKSLRKALSDGSRVAFIIELDAELIDSEQIEFYTEFWPNLRLSFGLQTLTPGALKAAKRRLNADRFEANLSRLIQNAPNISCQIDLIYGLPEDNYSGTLKTLDFALRMQADRIILQPFTLLPGTIYYSNAEHWGIKVDPDNSHIVNSTSSYSRKDMDRACELIVGLSFYNAGLLRGCLERLEHHFAITKSWVIQDLSRWLQCTLLLPKSHAKFQKSLEENTLPEIAYSGTKSLELMKQRRSLLLEYFKELSYRLSKRDLDAALCDIVRKNYIHWLFLYSDNPLGHNPQKIAQ